jgi:hypothetical protein
LDSPELAEVFYFHGEETHGEGVALGDMGKGSDGGEEPLSCEYPGERVQVAFFCRGAECHGKLYPPETKKSRRPGFISSPERALLTCN